MSPPDIYLPELSDAEAFALCYVLRGWPSQNSPRPFFLAWMLGMADIHGKVGAMFNIDVGALSTRILDLSPAGARGVIELVRRFSAYSREQPGCDRHVLLLRVRAELAPTAHQRLQALAELARLTGNDGARADNHKGGDHSGA
jgi:hypothetical protein